MARTKRDVRVGVGDDGLLEVSTPWSSSFVFELKRQVPPSKRRWDTGGKVWRVDPGESKAVAQIIRDVYQVEVAIPEASAVAPVPWAGTVEVRYVGAVKLREGGEKVAWGHDGVAWVYVFPLDVLEAHFGTDWRHAGLGLYGVLGVRDNARREEIRKAYRRMALQWHPDVCREEGAGERFLRIKRAYDVLYDDNLRSRYDAGLALSGVRTDTRKGREELFRPPLRSGSLEVVGTKGPRGLDVTRIVAWHDLVDSLGRTHVSSWARGADTYTERWV